MSRGYIGSPTADITAGVFTPQEHRIFVASNRSIGVQDTGGRGTDGAVLRQVMLTGDPTYGHLREVSMPTSYFDSHPSYQFPDWTDASDNVFCKIPRAWWWRGNMPDTSDGTTPRWTMLLSPVPRDGFASNPGAFKRSGAWLDHYYYGKYRGYNAGSSKVGSKAGQTPWGSVSFDNFRTYCANNGTGYHMGSLFEWHEILARCVIERKTFQIVPEADRQNAAFCKYRGIEEFAYHGPAVYVEWMDGIRTDSSGKYEIWLDADGSYTNTGVAAATYTEGDLGTNQGLRSGGAFDFLFIAATMGKESTSFIPDLSGRRSDRYGRICFSSFNAGHAGNGAFHSHFFNLPSGADANLGSRLAKW